MNAPTALTQYVESLPSSDELRAQLAKNIGERDLIKRLLKLVEHKERLAQNEAGLAGVAS